MTKYRATTKTFVDGKLYQQDEEFDTEATPSRTWFPVDKEAVDAFAKKFPDNVKDGKVTTPLGPIDLLPRKIDPKDAILKEGK